MSSLNWFNRSKQGITTSTEEKLEVPDGIWWKCPSCNKTIPTADLTENKYLCPACDYHARINILKSFMMKTLLNCYSTI